MGLCAWEYESVHMGVCGSMWDLELGVGVCGSDSMWGYVGMGVCGSASMWVWEYMGVGVCGSI